MAADTITHDNNDEARVSERGWQQRRHGGGAALHNTDAQSWDAICVTGGEDQQARHHTQSMHTKWGNARRNSHEEQVLHLGKRADGFTNDARMVSTCMC